MTLIHVKDNEQREDRVGYPAVCRF